MSQVELSRIIPPPSEYHHSEEKVYNVTFQREVLFTPNAFYNKEIKYKI